MYPFRVEAMCLALMVGYPIIRSTHFRKFGRIFKWCVVHAQDDDGKMKDSKKLNDRKDLYIVFKDDNFVCYLKRKPKEADKYNDTSVIFTYGVLEEKFINKYEFYTGDCKSKNDNIKYVYFADEQNHFGENLDLGDIGPVRGYTSWSATQNVLTLK